MYVSSGKVKHKARAMLALRQLSDLRVLIQLPAEAFTAYERFLATPGRKVNRML